MMHGIVTDLTWIASKEGTATEEEKEGKEGKEEEEEEEGEQ